MIDSIRKSLSSNSTTLLLSFTLAVMVWVSAVIANDPNIEQELPRGVSIELMNLSEDLILMNEAASRLNMQMRAPESIWELLNENNDAVSASIDLSNLQAGTHLVPVEYTINLQPVRVLEINPIEVEIVLEKRLDRYFEIENDVVITTALGFHSVDQTLSEESVMISGPQSLVNAVAAVRASLELKDVRETVAFDIPLLAYDADGDLVSGLDLYPETVELTQIVEQTGGYRDVAVRVDLLGQPAPGYRLTTISVSPPTVTVFSSDPDLVAALPGFVQTEQLTINGALDDIEIQLTLALPDGINVVGEQSVDVLVGVAAIESSKAVNVQLEVLGASPDHIVEIFPASVDVIISGPVTLLDNLQDGDVYFFVNAAEYEPGTYLLEPQVEFLSDHLTVESVSPETIQVVISIPPTPTPTSTLEMNGTPVEGLEGTPAAVTPTTTPQP